MPGLQANTAGMNVNGRDTVANAEYFQQELAGLRNNIDNLMNIWRGLSANEFNKSYQEQARNLDAFRQLLNDLGEAVSKGASILNRTEEENASAGAHLF
jgi:WXG100 family type VII secretion target